MTNFEGGPADGKRLMLRRAPVYVRVVIDRSGKVDALNERGDSPRDDETLFVYRHKPGVEPSACHLNCGRNKGSGFYAVATYVFHQAQPPQFVLRDQALWEEFVYAQVQN